MSTSPIVIIAEPDPMIRNVLRVEFAREDFAVFLASTAPDAERYAAHTVVHLVIIDVKLGIAAYEACVRIRRRPGYASLPIVLTTGDPSPQMRSVAQQAGATVVLAKPYSVADLFSAIRPFLPPDDLLFTHRAAAPGMAAAQEWIRGQEMTWCVGGTSAVSRNGRFLPIVRAKGAVIPLYRMPVSDPKQG